MNETSLGFVLKVNPYKEYDALVFTFLKEYGKVTFLYRGYFKSQSKMLSKGLNYTLYEFRYNYREEGLLNPIEVTSIQSFSKLLLSPQKASLAQIIDTIYLALDHHDQPSDLYALYYRYLSALESARYDELLVVSLLLSELLHYLGLSPFVDGAINSKEKKVNDFSIKLGGFVLEPHKSLFSLEELKQIRYIYKGRLKDLDKLKEFSVNRKLMNLFIEFFEFHTSIKLNSYSVYQQLG